MPKSSSEGSLLFTNPRNDSMSAKTQQQYQSAYVRRRTAPAEGVWLRFVALPAWARFALLGLIGLVLVLASVALFTHGSRSGSSAFGSGKDAFNMSYPKTWSPLPKREVALLPGHPVAVLRRNTGGGLVAIREQRSPAPDLNKLGGQITRQLKGKDPSVTIHTQKVVKIRSGPALLTTYINRAGQVQSLVVVPAGSRTFTIDSVSPGGADDVAREIGKMIISFDATP
jgi:hypothetical protein